MKRNLPTVLAGFIGGVLAALALGATGVLSSDSATTVVSGARDATDVRVGATPLSSREIYKRDAPGVVFIKSQVTRTGTDPFGFGGEPQSGVSTGSGFVISKSGFILTNFHVVDGASNITVTFDDRRTVPARVVGRDASTDLALLKVNPAAASLHPLKLGDSSRAQVGDPVLAIGNPFGLDRTLTTGVVSALQRELRSPNGFTINDVIQTDAAINPGNSGGPLLNTAGEVVGVNSQIETGGGSSSGNVGIGFAVPINTARKILPQLEQGKSVERGWLGVEVATVDESLASLKLPAASGALIQRITPGSPAVKAGLRGGTRTRNVAGQEVTVGGDIIVEANGRPIRTASDLQAAIGGEAPGAKVRITVKRGDKTITETVTLAKRPDQAR